MYKKLEREIKKDRLRKHGIKSKGGRERGKRKERKEVGGKGRKED